MTVATLFTDIRYQLSDELKTGYDDAELIGYLNQTNEFMYATLMNHESNLALKSALITLTDGVGALPSDFELDSAIKDTNDVPLHAVAPSITPTSTQYSLFDSNLYSDNDSVTLFYFYMPDTYTAITDTLLIPAYFRNLYRQMIKFLAFNTDEFDTTLEQQLMSRFESTILEISGKYGSTNPKATMPFKV